jgi:hypothetical protein
MSEPADVNPYQAPAASSPYSDQAAYYAQADASVTPLAVEMLRQTQPWVRFLSVLAYIAFALVLIGALVVLAFGVSTGSGEMLFVFPIYALLGALYLAPAIFLGRYASCIARLRMSLRARDLEGALAAQKSFWRFAGILALVVIAFYALVIIFIIFGPGSMTFFRISPGF